MLIPFPSHTCMQYCSIVLYCTVHDWQMMTDDDDTPNVAVTIMATIISRCQPRRQCGENSYSTVAMVQLLYYRQCHRCVFLLSSLCHQWWLIMVSLNDRKITRASLWLLEWCYEQRPRGDHHETLLFEFWTVAYCTVLCTSHLTLTPATHSPACKSKKLRMSLSN